MLNYFDLCPSSKLLFFLLRTHYIDIRQNFGFKYRMHKSKNRVLKTDGLKYLLSYIFKIKFYMYYDVLYVRDVNFIDHTVVELFVICCIYCIFIVNIVYLLYILYNCCIYL